MKIIRLANNDQNISLVDWFSQDGANFVVFKIRDKRYSYQLSFQDWINKVRVMAKYSTGKALAWAKKNATTAFEVTENYPSYGSIIRQIKEDEQEEETKETKETKEKQLSLGY